MLALGAVLILLLAACGDDVATSEATDDDPVTTTTTPVPGPDTPDTPDTPDVVVAMPSSLYFVAAVTEPSAGGVVDALVATGRPADEAGRPDEALAALLAGPSEFEVEIGFSSAIPVSTELNGVTVADGVATADLGAAFEEPSGAFSDTLRVAQVVFTLTAFDEIDTVRFSIDGNDRDVIGSHGIDVDGPDGRGLGRDDISEARPPILVEAPVPGATLGDELVVSGEANTFEATVRWAITDPEGEILDEGFTTASAGNGTWGTFSFTIASVADAEIGRGGLASLILWEDSPVDGRQTNLVEVPLRWSEGPE
ncbi:MAG: Gmad2 immunoglobulin-like domain-containing protein [Acidimicrobiales bacterium]